MGSIQINMNLKGKDKGFSESFYFLSAEITRSWCSSVEIHIQKYLTIQKLWGYLKKQYLLYESCFPW